MTHRACMPLLSALEVLQALRADQVVITTMGSAREWPKLSQHRFDFQYLPSAMGHSTALGLGLALAQPAREVIAFTGDGGLLMSLGSLVTIAASGAKNLTVVLLDNGRYEVTGGQSTAASGVAVDYVAIARGAGIASAWSFVTIDAWRAAAATCLEAPGPRFIALAVEQIDTGYQLPAPTPIPLRARQLRDQLQT